MGEASSRRVEGRGGMNPTSPAVPAAQAAADPGHALLRGLSPALDGTALSRTPTGKPMNNLELVENLCAVSPTLREARHAHVQAYGTLIPHVFMAAVVARVGQCLLRSLARATPQPHAELQGILAALEQGMASGDRETRNVIAISFVRDSELEMFFDELRQWLGPRMLGQMRGK